jgi:hypothetical protein
MQIQTTGSNNTEQIKRMALFGSSTMIVSSVFQDEKNVLNDLKLA